MLYNNFSQFKNNESGAVTVGWVVLTAAIVGIAIAVIGLISGGVETASDGINDELEIAGGLGDWFDGPVYGSDSDFSPWGHLYEESYNQGMSTANNGDLEALYVAAYNDALLNPDPVTIDTLAGFEAAMVDKGVEIPNGNSTASKMQIDS